MPRTARVVLPGIPVHVVHRGHGRGRCFFDDADRERYLGHLTVLARQGACAVHAYVLMPNHVHLLATPARGDALAWLMHRLAQRHAQRLNRERGRTGAVWEGRFHSSLVLDERHLIRCYRYIETNPVRAGMVAHPRDWPWSSYAANAEGRPSPIVVPRPEFEALDPDPVARRAAYRALVDEILDPEVLAEIRRAATGNRPLLRTAR